MKNNNNPIAGIFTKTIIGVIKQAGKLCLITLAWGFKFSGVFLSRIGETLESAIVKSHR